MRVLFTTWSWPSHLYPLVPLAWAFRSAGHEVLVAGEPGVLPEITAAGLPGVAVGHEVDSVGLVRGYVLPSESGPTVDGGPTPRTGRGPRALRMLEAHAESMTDDLVEVARSWGADLIVYEPTALAGPLAAAATGVPAVRHLYGGDLLLRARGLLPELLAPLARRHGVDTGADTFAPLGTVTVDPTPPGFQPPSEDRRLPMRYVPYNGAGSVGRSPLGPPGDGRRRTVVTWGYTMAKLHPELFLAGRAAEALAADDTEVVLAVSAAQRPLLDGVPGVAAGVASGAVRIVEDVPLHLLMDDASLVVAHGGAGTALTALQAGLPLLLVPQLPDHAGHSARVEALGAGTVLTRDEATPERIREAARALLADDAKQRAAAREARTGLLDQPTPAELVGELLALGSGVAAA